LLRVFRGFISKLSANYRLLITQYSYRLPNMYLSTDMATGIPWDRPGMRNDPETWFPERLGLIVN